MPELPDVAVLQRYLDATALHQEIAGVEVEDTDVLVGVSPGLLASRLRGCCFASTRRYGKYLFAGTDQGEWVAFHFGMTGFLKYYRDAGSEPGHPRAWIHFTDEGTLAFDCRRKLGHLELLDDPRQLVERQELGPDPLAGGFALGDFRDAVSGRRGSIKAALMNQKVLAGLGNVYSDEVLFQAEIHPRTPVRELGEEALRHLFHTLRRVLETAIERGARDFPEGWLVRRREEGAGCPRCGGEIARGKIAGRSSYFCRRHQPAPPAPEGGSDIDG